MRAAYLEHGRGIGARRPLGAAAHWRATYLGRGGHRLLARNPPKRGHGSDAGVRLQLGRAYAPPHRPPTRRAGAAAGMHVGTEPSASRAPSVEREGIRPRAFAGARQCRRLQATPAAGPTALRVNQ